MVRIIVQVVRSMRTGIAELDAKIEEAAAAHPDFFIFESRPGAGAVMAPRLLAAFGSQRERYTGADEVQTFSGIAPVRETSGKSSGCIFVGRHPSFYAKPSTSGLDIPLHTRRGREAITSSNAAKAADTMPRCAGWLSDGFASFSVAGKIRSPMTRTSIWPRSPGVALPWWLPAKPPPSDKSDELFVDKRWKKCGGHRSKLKKMAWSKSTLASWGAELRTTSVAEKFLVPNRRASLRSPCIGMRAAVESSSVRQRAAH